MNEEVSTTLDRIQNNLNLFSSGVNDLHTEIIRTQRRRMLVLGLVLTATNLVGSVLVFLL